MTRSPFEKYILAKKQEGWAESNFITRIFLRKSASNKTKKCKRECFEHLDTVLQTEDLEYKELVRQNLNLIKTESIKFTAYEFSQDSFTRSLEGRLSKNGNYYLSATRTGWYEPTFGFEYPSGFVGTIDHFGRIKLEAKDINMGWRSMVKTFVGSIDASGHLSIEANKRESEAALLTGGKLNIQKMIGKQFSKNSRESAIFFHNASKMKKIIRSKFEELIAEVNRL